MTYRFEPQPPDGIDKLMIIDSFTGVREFLANDHPTMIRVNDAWYQSAEAAYQALKTLDLGQRALVAHQLTARESHQVGQSVTLRPGWDDYVRFTVMLQVLRAKFSATRERAALQGTGTALLIHGNEHHDQFWGSCRCGLLAECERPGLNHLGRLLMIVREENAILDRVAL